MKNYNQCYLLFVWSVAVITHVTGQHTVKNVTRAETLFSSPGYVDSLNYGFNTTRNYRFQTYITNHTLLLTVKEFVMEPADKNGDCLYDKVTVYDGYDESSTVLKTLCDTIPAGTTYSTTGDTVYVVFYSDGTNPYKGFQMSVHSDGPATTTSTTSTTTTSTTSTTSTTATTSTTSTTSSTTSASTAAPPTTAANGQTTNGNTQQTQKPGNNGGDSVEDDFTWVIVGCCVGGLILLVLIAIIVYCLKKDKRPATPPSSGDTVKRVLWSRSNTTMVQPIDVTKTSVPPGEIVQTNIFDMELPAGKANLLPPLSSNLNPPPKNVLFGKEFGNA